MGGQLCLCVYSARDSGNDNRGAMPVSYIIRNDKYRACTSLLRADNGVKFCVVNIPTLNRFLHLFEQIRTIDKKRLQEYIGMLSESEMARVDKALAISVSLNILKGTK